MIQYGIAALEKDLAILFGLRPVLDHLGSSASINITLREYSRALSSHRRFDAARLTGQHAEFLLLSRRPESLGRTDMSFTSLLDSWSKQEPPATTDNDYPVRLSVDDAARIHALADLYPGMDTERIITDLISASLDELEAAMPYVPGERVIREDDHGDPIYEDTGPTPRFLELTRKYQKKLQDKAS